MKSMMLFEEFTAITGKPFIEKLRIYALASDSVKKVSQISLKGKELTFTIETNLPGDYNGDTKTFNVVVPTDRSVPYVETYEGGKKVLTVKIEPMGGQEEFSIMNYLEATQLFNDPSIRSIVDIYKDLKDPQQIRNMIKSLG
jgi:hypothetical protein